MTAEACLFKDVGVKPVDGQGEGGIVVGGGQKFPYGYNTSDAVALGAQGQLRSVTDGDEFRKS